jgi:hypothetical protein
VKRIRGDESIGVVYAWKYHKETPCVPNFTSKKQNSHVFLFTFFFYIFREQEGRTDVGGVGTSGGGVAGKWGRRVNMMQKMCTHVCKCKNNTC